MIEGMAVSKSKQDVCYGCLLDADCSKQKRGKLCQGANEADLASELAAEQADVDHANRIEIEALKSRDEKILSLNKDIAETREEIRLLKIEVETYQLAAQPGEPAPCGHPEQYSWSPDGKGKKIICLRCRSKKVDPLSIMVSRLFELATSLGLGEADRKLYDRDVRDALNGITSDPEVVSLKKQVAALEEALKLEQNPKCASCFHRDCIHSRAEGSMSTKHEHPGCRNGRGNGYVPKFDIQGTVTKREPTKSPIPTTLEEAIAEIKSWEDSKRWAKISTVELAGGRVHHGCGTGIRNEWGLWTGSPLAHHLYERFGLAHADDMSGLIFHCAYQEMNSKPWGAEKVVAKYVAHWAKNGGMPKPTWVAS